MRLIDMPQHIIGSFARLERKKSIYLAPNKRANIACTALTAVADLSPDQPVAGDPSISVTFPHRQWADPLQLDQHLCDLIGLR